MPPLKLRALLNRRPLEPGESLPSLLARLQIANYYHHRSNPIVSLCQPHLPPGEYLYLPGFAETWPVLEKVTGLPAADLYEATLHRYVPALALPGETVSIVSLPDGRRVPVVSGRMRRLLSRPVQDAQYCPSCLAKGSYHRLRWLNLLVAVCPEHECLLQRGCPNCLQKLPVSAIVSGDCPGCGHDLASASPISVRDDAWGKWAHYYLQSLLGDIPTPPEPVQIVIPDQPASILLELLAGIAATAARLPEALLYKAPFPSSSSAPSAPREAPTPTHVYHIYATALKAISQWPRSFHEFLETYGRRPDVSVGQVTDEFDFLYSKWLEERWRRPEFSFVQEAFDDFLVANYSLTRSVTRLDRYQRSRELRDRFPYLPQAEASERLQVEPEIVQRLVDVEMLVDFERGEGDERHWHQRLRVVRRTEFVDLQQRWQSGIPPGDVAQVLGVDGQIVENLVDENLLARCSTDGESDDSWRIETASLNSLVRKLNRYPVLPGNFGEPVAVWELVESGYDLVEIVQQAAATEVTAFWPGGGLPSLWVNQSDMHLLRG